VLERTAIGWNRVDSGTLRLDPDLSIASRLDGAYRGVVELLRLHAPDLVVIEECFVARGPKAALVLGEVRGVLLLAVHQAGCECYEVAPRAIKLAVVGHGGASKEQIQYMVPRLIEGSPARLLADEADALAIAWCGASRRAVAALAQGRTKGTTR
jgi:crossover junction endodeoxyribonuclease RuvC